MNAVRLLEYFDRIAEAPDAVSRLRKFILDLAVRGKLVEQDPDDEPASELLKKIKSRNSQESKKLKDLLLLDCFERPQILPSGWAMVPLISLGKWAIGSGFPKNEQGCEDGPYFFIKVSDMNLPGNEKFIVSANNFIDDESSRRMRAKIHPKGTIVFPKIGGAIATNKRRILTCGSAIDNNCLGITFWCELSLEWCYLLMVSIDFAQYQAGTAVPALQQGVLEKIPVFLPPLAEQHRIVAKVDELMALCDRLEASQVKRESRRDRLASSSLKRIGQPEDVGNGEEFRENVRFHLHHLPRLATRPEHVKELRQTILNLAVRGKLSQSRVGDFVAQKYKDLPSDVNLPRAWRLLNFGKFCDIEGGTQPPKSKFIEEPRDGYVRLYQIRDLGNRPVPVYIPIDGMVRFCREGEILIGRYGASVGKIFWAKNGAYNVALARFVYPEDAFTASFAFLVLRSYWFQSHLIGASRSAQAGFNKSDLAVVNFPLPPLAEQHRIVAQVDELMKLCDKLEVQLAANQTNQSRLLEATLCDALGVTCLSASRPSRPAPSLKRVAVTHSEQPPKPLVARPAPVQTPTAAVQGSLVEQPTLLVGKPRAANGDVSGAILAQMQPGQEYSRAQLAEALGLSVYEWNMAIRELKESGRVVQTGERRGARYRIQC